MTRPACAYWSRGASLTACSRIPREGGRSKLNIIEQEFKYAEKTEFWRLKEEEEMRRTIQVKRERALLDAKRIEKARRIREENRIRKGIISAVRNVPSENPHAMLDMTRPVKTQETEPLFGRRSRLRKGDFVTQAATD